MSSDRKSLETRLDCAPFWVIFAILLVRRKFRCNRNAVWCTDFCGTVLYHKTSGRTCAEKTAAAGADEGIYRA